MSNKDVTIQEYIDAIRKNGLPQHFGRLVDKHYSHNLDTGEKVVTIVGACAFGQACINLGIQAYYYGDDPMAKCVKRTIYLNDTANLPLNEIADFLEAEFADSLHYVATFQEEVW